ncbi:UDP-N-acetylmuramate--L-alanine ligase [Methylococcaceae bacterium CS1]|nr:UDP-N-acetylmuramate--L-alanine ligase [Methyloprofundus sp.]TXK96156.1 UDP-N-acetylmuramate--L-alanine ligase [Methylococcaceae bacterium CS4]TXK97762.1 UDP-N-acetylmuramate--L-alanine ligase [Methylococcaceae bacterium CS5]TXL05798.1 UDP-N-acetylmuramate--L-alanine ligase [Methylococcaceae bacterium CS1]TXL08148.1 UDP-N-acetylmuramate--L-alanine ligase [Methylococcaceae bacterium CS3]TXL10277.1 UDP-N-acetylmuramate--L-alanine ligase [Methylococcaceae bacterium CS2]
MKDSINQIIRNRLTKMQKIHFVGVGGTGMSGIAEVMSNLGCQVSGSDIKESAVTERLTKAGVIVHIGHAQSNVANVDVLVTSTAVDKSNVEVQYAYQHRIPVIPRAEMLAELMRFRFGIAVAGTHGKTTTTSLVASILAEGGLDPTFVIGGRLNSAGTNAQLGQGQYLVAEADESDASFLHLQPIIAVVTNIDQDHMETYEGSFSRLKNTFIEFLYHVPFYGLAVLCIDDAGVREILPQLSKPIRTYGTDVEADVRAINIKQQGMCTRFTVTRWDGHQDIDVALNMPGLHNMQNALAAITIATELNVPDQAIIKSLAEFKGVGRRFQVNGEIALSQGTLTLVDDYGHHPREVAATMEALKQAWPDKRSVVVFQPHRYSRTRDLFEDFVNVLSTVDVLILLEIYPAGEEPIQGADGRALSSAIRARAQVNPVFVENSEDLAEILVGIIKPNDVLLTMGAGNVGHIATELPQQIIDLVKK